MKKSSSLKQTFIKGLALLFPTLITVFVLIKVWDLVYNTLGGPITNAMLYFLDHNLGVDLDKIGHPWYLTLIGFSLATFFVFVVGLLVATFIGRGTFGYFERLFATIPVIRVIYPYAKQVTDFFASGGDAQEFSEVVMVEYPRRGIFSLGFVTGKGLKGISNHTGKDIINLFMPSSPTPITGYVINVARDDVRPVQMNIEEAMRFIVSGGVLVPPHQMTKKQKRETSVPLFLDSPDEDETLST